MKSLLGLLQLLFLFGVRPVQSQTSGSVLRFQLIQGGTKTVFANLTNNSVIQIPPNTSPNFNLEAVTTGGPITSVRFGYNDNANFRVEKMAPYALCGDNAGIFKGCIPPNLGIGSHSVNATITNTGQSRVIRFQILNTQVPTPVLAPVVAPTPVLAPVMAPTPVRAPVNAPIPTAVAPTPVIFTFIYTVNNTDIIRLVNGTVIKMDDFEQASFNIRAEAINTTAIKSVRLLPINRSETAAPWSYCGKTVNGTRVQYRKCVDFAVEGTYTITARPYTGRQQSGTQLPDVAVFFYLVGQPRPPPITTFPFFINCGGPTFSDSQQRTWMEDMYFTGGKTYSNSAIDIVNTVDDAIYQSERYGIFVYQIPVPLGSYSVILHLAEIYQKVIGKRVFDVSIEGSLILDIDILQRTNGATNKAITIDFPVAVSDGLLTVQFMENIPRLDNAKVNGIEVQLIGPHFAHAVTGGPYSAVDTDGDGVVVVPVDGSESHTHAPDETLNSFIWKTGTSIIGAGEATTLSFLVGQHAVTLTVTDTGNDSNTATTTVTVLPQSYPALTSISPASGSIAGGTRVTISGSSLQLATAVRFGTTLLTGTAITVVNATTITVLSPFSGVEVPAAVSVITPTAESNAITFNYIAAITIQFAPLKLMDIVDPTAVAFGPDSKLYVGTLSGQLAKITLNENFDTVIGSVVATINATRGIHGIAFDPLDSADTLNPTVYISTSDIFHRQGNNSVGDAVNGKIQTVRGANLDQIADIVTGLPVSALDHSVNGIYFGNNGELYIAVGGNTNAGIPGELSRNLLMRENYFSSAILVAHLGKADFKGFISYDAVNDGTPTLGFGPSGVEVFASGLRNPFGVVMHSNGKIYATDNGPNVGFGDMATGCGPGQFIPDKEDVDELNLIVRNGWYGHPNHKRGQTDPRQCAWKGTNVASTADYTAPLMTLRSSTDGIIEFNSNHFAGAMRHNLIVSKYKDGLFRIIVSSDGNSVVPNSKPAIALSGDNGLAVTQAPNGNLMDARYTTNECYVYIPGEPSSTTLKVFSIFPRRGGLAGGTTVRIYGANFNGPSMQVTVGGVSCTNVVVSNSNTVLKCTLPPSASVGRKDVVVDNGSGIRTTLNFGYQYITGRP